MEKIKPLLPSLREKKRYIAFEIVSENVFVFKQVADAVLNSVLKYSGIKGLAEMGLVILKEKYEKNKGVLRISTKCVNQLKASFCLLKEINNKPVLLKSLGISGVLKNMNKYIENKGDGNSCNLCHIN